MGGSGPRRHRAHARLAALFAALVATSGSVVPPAVHAASPAPSVPPPIAQPPAVTAPGGPTVVPAGAAPIVLRTAGGSASAVQSAPGRNDVPVRSVDRAPAPPTTKTELVSQRTEHTRTFALPDGRYALEATEGRMNFQDASGNWQPVDLSLKPNADPVYGLQVAALDRTVELGSGNAHAGVARLTTSEGSISLATAEAGDATTETSGKTTTGVDFAGQNGPQPRVSVRPTDTGFEFSAIWQNAQVAPRLDFTLDAGVLTPSLGDDGRTVVLSALDATTGISTPVGVISEPVILEGGESGAPAMDQSAVTVSLVPASGTAWTLSYSIDPVWLSDPARAFPVVLDPSACLGEGASGCTINGTGVNIDHFVVSGAVSGVCTAGNCLPTGWNVFRVGYDNRGYGYASERGLAYFESVTLPDGATVYDTDLQLHISSEYGSPSGDTIHAYRITSPWSQSTTWNQFGTGGNGFTSTAGVIATIPTSGYMHFDPDAIVQSWYTQRAQGWTQNLGFAFQLNHENSTTGDVEFSRYNDGTLAYRPKLTIYYDLPQAKLTFDPALGPNYSPSTMLASVATTLPVRVQNLSGGTFTSYASNTTDYYDLGYRFFDQKGNVAATGTTHLPANIANGATSATIALGITAPAATGPYSLRLDLVRFSAGTAAWASDYASPTKFYARAKQSTASDNTRWTGNSIIERDEFSVQAVSTTPAGGEWKSVKLGDGGSLAINLWSRDLEYAGSGGVGFSDLLPVALDYGYRLSASADATGVLGANGWWTNLDERLIGGTGSGDFTYQDGSGNRYAVNTNNDAQLLGAPVRLDRPRVTIWDDNGATGTYATLGDIDQVGMSLRRAAAIAKETVDVIRSNGPSAAGRWIRFGETTNRLPDGTYKAYDWAIRFGSATKKYPLPFGGHITEDNWWRPWEWAHVNPWSRHF